MKKRLIIAGLLTLLFCMAVSASATGLKIPQFGLYIPSTGGMLAIPIVVDSFPGQVGGFHLCVAERGYDFTVLNVEPGEFMTTCGWEYLNWRRVSVPQELITWPFSQRGHLPTSLIEITGYASVTADYQASCYDNGPRMELVRLHVAMAAPSWEGQVNPECMARSLSFFWRDCFDNVLYNRNLDTVFSASGLFSPFFGYSPSDSANIPFPGFGAPDATCSSVTPAFNAVNGSYDLVCTDSVNPWIGDINCDGYAYTIADVIAYTRYFLWGIGTLFCGESSIAGSDINHDGMTLTVADLVQLIRITVGDGFYLDPIWVSTEFMKPVAFEKTTEISVADKLSGSTCAISSDADIAACYLRLIPTDDHPLSVSSFGKLAPEAMIGSIGDTITLLWINQSGEAVFSAGNHTLFSADHPNFRIVHSEIVDMDARPMAVTISQSLPTEFRLEQNIPNPFNPTTVIGYYLPSAAQVTLDVYNVNGQRIVRLINSHQEAGYHAAEWNAVDQAGNAVASGIYFYRLETNGNVATKKMLLLK